jgi:hypothetical protein
LLILISGTNALRATETENQVLRILPAPGKVVVDGKVDDWDLSGGIFACGDVERLRDQYGVWFHAMYDTENVYLLARWLDLTPMNNRESSKGGQGFQGDCLQVRFITGHKTPREAITWLTCWRDRDGISVVDPATPHGTGRGGVELPDLPNALRHGAQQAFRINADSKGYVHELAIPWKLLCKDGKMPALGSELRVTVEPTFTAGAFGRLTIKDLFHVGAVPNRIFTFYAYDIWGAGILEKTGKVAPAPLRLADGRELPVRLVGGLPVVDWSRLAKVRELPGFKTLAFKMPFDGHVSLNLRNKDGVIVRQLLTDHPYVKGSHTVKWDGLPTPHYRTPGEPLPAGEHTYYGCYEIASGKLLWSYPDPFFQVHGSHHAPASEPGLTRGAYGFVGTFTHPNTGTVWAINANLGKWYLLIERGYFLAGIQEAGRRGGEDVPGLGCKETLSELPGRG